MSKWRDDARAAFLSELGNAGRHVCDPALEALERALDVAEGRPRPVTAADVQRYAEMILSELPDSSGLPTFASAARRATERIIADVLSPAPDPLSAYQAASNELHYAEEDQRAAAEAVAAERERVRSLIVSKRDELRDHARQVHAMPKTAAALAMKADVLDGLLDLIGGDS